MLTQYVQLIPHIDNLNKRVSGLVCVCICVCMHIHIHICIYLRELDDCEFAFCLKGVIRVRSEEGIKSNRTLGPAKDGGRAREAHCHLCLCVFEISPKQKANVPTPLHSWFQSWNLLGDPCRDA